MKILVPLVPNDGHKDKFITASIMREIEDHAHPALGFAGGALDGPDDEL
ncbi:MAG TPA: hypothetical protein VH678_27035 [Xanthobacteraceae bacterium]|jgi:hypothetical protein